VCQLSIIVPLLNDPQPFEDTLVSVLENRPAGCEVLVVHPGDYEDPYGLSDEVTFIPVAPTANVIAMVNAAAQAAAGRVLHLLQPGVLAEDGWTDAAVLRFRDSEIAAVAPLVLDARDPNRVLAAGLRYSSAGRVIVQGMGTRLSRAARTLRSDITGPSRLAAFYRRSVFMALEGFCPQAGLWFADIDLGLCIRRLGFACELECQSTVTGFEEDIAAPLNFLTGRQSERLFRQHYRHSAGTLSLPAHVAGIISAVLMRPHQATTYTHLAGRLSALFATSGHRELRRRLQRAGQSYGSSCSSNQTDEEDEQPAWPRSHPARRMVA
jgi:hypothetical protein